MATYRVLKFERNSMDDMDNVASTVKREAKHAQLALVVSATDIQRRAFDEVARKIIDTIQVTPRQSLPGPALAIPSSEFLDFFAPILRSTIDRVAALSDAAISDGVKHYCEMEIERACISIGIHLARYRGKNIPVSHQLYICDTIMGLADQFEAHILSRVLTVRQALRTPFQDISLSTALDYDPTDESRHGRDRVEMFHELRHVMQERIQAARSQHTIPVVSGYFGYVPGGAIATAGTEYGDTVAALTAIALRELKKGSHHAVELNVVTKLGGIYSGDPRIIEPNFHPDRHFNPGDFSRVAIRRHVSLTQVAELANRDGGSVLNRAALARLAHYHSIDLSVHGMAPSSDPGTTIRNRPDTETPNVMFVTGRRHQALYTVHSIRMIDETGTASHIIDIPGRYGIPTDIIPTPGTGVSFSVPDEHVGHPELESDLKRLGKMSVQRNIAFVSCVGSLLHDIPDFLRRASLALAQAGVKVLFPAGDFQKNATFVVPDSDYASAIRALHSEFSERDTRQDERSDATSWIGRGGGYAL